MLNRIIGGFMTVLIGTSLVPEIVRQVHGSEKTQMVSNETIHQKQTYLDYVNERLEVERLMR